jgi:alkylhydroperoxidase/carboxymuconolactone decarboxylase family protein YurZ
MTENPEPSGAQKMFGDFAPGLVGFTDEGELIEAITHLAFYAGWPKAMAAMAVAKQVFRAN